MPADDHDVEVRLAAFDPLPESRQGQVPLAHSHCPFTYPTSTDLVSGPAARSSAVRGVEGIPMSRAKRLTVPAGRIASSTPVSAGSGSGVGVEERRNHDRSTSGKGLRTWECTLSGALLSNRRATPPPLTAKDGTGRCRTGPHGGASSPAHTAEPVWHKMLLPLVILLALPLGQAHGLGLGADSSGLSFALEPVPEDLLERHSSEELAILEKLNRVDVDHLARLETMVVPDRWDLDEVEYSPLPSEATGLVGYEKALVVHQPSQVFGAYKDGRLVRWGPVSTGREEHPTPAGRFHLNWRSPGRHSTVSPDWYLEWYYNFHNARGLSFHQYSLPGEPASHACVRLLERDARWVYEWGEGWTLDETGREVLEKGTPVLILGEYEFGAPPPWRDASSPHSRVEIDRELDAEG